MDIICDIDGTVADLTHRLHFVAPANDWPADKKFKPDWDAFFAHVDQDPPIKPVVKVVRALLDAGHRIIFVTGRPQRLQGVTAHWLSQQFKLRNSLLYTRRDGDFRADDIIKRELLQQLREEGFSPQLAIDDRKRVVDMWRAEGLICMQVADGDF